MSDQIPRKLTTQEAGGMTVNERLWVSGHMLEYEEAELRRDIVVMTDILKKIHLDDESIKANIRFAINKK